jgi:predicted nucleic acid-binding protein
MTLVDTSVWIDHLRVGNRMLRSLLENGEVVAHPFVVGELACGTLRNRKEILTLLQALPEAQVAEHEEVMRVVEREQLYGQGIGWMDAHLLASARLSRAALWTLDRHLSKIASQLKLTAISHGGG